MAQSHGHAREAGRQAHRLAISSAANPESSCEDALPPLGYIGLLFVSQLVRDSLNQSVLVRKGQKVVFNLLPSFILPVNLSQ